ncbi:MAG: (2Fe-2S)-binding protein [Bacteroidetes bacterium]|nr:(2Fe-2S)-binding protein [Bacteroidota bacterium]
MNSVVCFCYGITVEDLEHAVSKGAKTPESVMAATGAGDGCTSCHPDLDVIVPALVKKLKLKLKEEENSQLGLF